MYARVATFEGGDFERARAEANRRMETDEGPPGMKGYFVLHDPDTTQRLFVTFFDTREEAEEADRLFDKMGDEIPEEIRGRRTTHYIGEVVAQQLPAMV